jgi:hypothetical protein
VLAAALALLPHLTSLALGEGAVAMLTDSCKVLSAVAGNLTHLYLWGNHSMEAVTRILNGPDMLLSLRQLQRIELSNATLDDAGLRALVTHLPHLKHVAVCTCELLTTCQAGTACDWEELWLTGCLDTAAITRLPLQGVRKLTTWSVLRRSGNPDTNTTAADLAAALAAAPDCVLSCPRAASRAEFTCNADELALLLPRWRCGAGACSMERLFVSLTYPDTDCLTPAVVGALASLLERTPSCTELHITDFRPPDADIAPLLPALRNTAIRDVIFDHDDMTEEQLLSWCAGRVGRPMAVRCVGSTLVGQQARVRQALQEAGSDVTLLCDFADDEEEAGVL